MDISLSQEGERRKKRNASAEAILLTEAKWLSRDRERERWGEYGFWFMDSADKQWDGVTV